MRGFEIEKTGYEITDAKEGLAEKILKVPGIALVAAGSASCLSALYNAAERADALIVFSYVKSRRPNTALENRG